MVISNERIEYFAQNLFNRSLTVNQLLKNCSVVIKNREDSNKPVSEEEINKFAKMVSANKEEIIVNIDKTLDDAIKQVNDIDFPRRPLNKDVTDKLIEKELKVKYADLLENEKITINPLQIEFDDVSQIFNNDRLENIDKFKDIYNKKIKNVIDDNKGKINCFLITEKEKNSIKQKHTFLVINYNNENYIFDSAGHEKYVGAEKTVGDDIASKIPNVAMFSDFLKENGNNKLFYNHTRIQADHVNCYTMAYMTLDNLLYKMQNGLTSIELEKELKSYFQNQATSQIFNEGLLKDFKANDMRKVLLPPEFLVNAQMDSLYNKIINAADKEFI